LLLLLLLLLHGPIDAIERLLLSSTSQNIKRYTTVTLLLPGLVSDGLTRLSELSWSIGHCLWSALLVSWLSLHAAVATTVVVS